MTLVSSKEFTANQERYFSLAINEDVCIKNGENIFRLTYSPVEETKKRKYKQPDEDFYRAISMEELRKRVKEDIHQWYKEKNESYSTT